MIPIIIIQGPTASGKSSLALKLAKHLNTEIISADSRQIYKFLNIGTAKPTFAEQSIVKHHLIDIITPDEIYNAGKFVDDADAVIKNLHAKSKIPIIVGGTGFYIQALTNGIFESPKISTEIKNQLNDEFNKHGLEFLYNKLINIEPQAKSRIEQNDKQRILRALSVFMATNKTLTQHWAEQKKKIVYNSFNILVNSDRNIIYEKINMRLDTMLKNGLLQEIKSIFDMGYKKDAPGFNSVGYKEFLPYFEDNNKLGEYLELAKRNSRRYAKRQLTWYRRLNFDFVFDSKNIKFIDIQRKIDNFLNR